MKITILIPDPDFIRKVGVTGSFSALESLYDITYIVPDYFEYRLEDYGKYIDLDRTYVFQEEPSRKVNWLRKLENKVFMFRNADKCSTYSKYNKMKKGLGTLGTIRRRFLLKVYQFLGQDFVFKILGKINDSFELQKNRVYQQLKVHRPDLLFASVSGSSQIHYDAVTAAQRVGAKTVFMPMSWDNISSKIFFANVPDFVIERGEQNVKITKDIMGLSSNNVFKVGVPHYEMYYDYLENSDLEKRKEVFFEERGLPKGKRIILFGGSFRPFHEAPLLKEIDDLIESGVLANCHIFYRPHPERMKRDCTDDIGDYNFQHLTFDEEMRAAYSKRGLGYQPSLTNFLDLYNAVDIMVSPYSSVMVEAGLFGKPVVGISFPDGVHFGDSSVQAMVTREHFRHLKQLDWFTDCDNSKQLADSLQRSLAIANENRREGIRKDLEHIVFRDNLEYSDRIINCFKQIVAEMSEEGSQNANSSVFVATESKIMASK